MKQQLIETPEEDSEIFELASIIAEYLKDQWKEYRKDNEWYEDFKQEIKKIKSSKKKMDIFILDNTRITKIVNINAVKTQALKKFVKLYRVNLLYISPDKAGDEYDGYHSKSERLIAVNYRNARNIEKLESILTHEIRHAVDLLRSVPGIELNQPVRQAASLLKTGKALDSRSKQDKENAEDNFNDYLAEPHEVNARFTQVTRALNKFIKDDPSLLKMPNALKLIIEKLFDHYDISTVYRDGVNNTKYKRLLIRIYKFIDAELSHIGKVSPEAMAYAPDVIVMGIEKLFKKIY